MSCIGPILRRYYYHIVGSLLISAAVLKVFSTNAPHASPRLTIANVAIAVELLIGCLLVLGANLAWIRWVVTALFMLFFAVSVHGVLSGTQACGCFGAIAVPPEMMVVIDAAVMCGCIFIPIADTRRAPISLYRLSATGFAAIAISVFIWYAADAAQSWSLNRVVSSVEDGVLRPDSWLNRQFPLTSSIRDGGAMYEGQWLVLIYHHDCETCQRALNEYIRFAGTREATSRNLKVMAVELPPYGDDYNPYAHVGIQSSRLDTSRRWFSPGPTALRLSDGIVVKAAQSERAVRPENLID